MTETGIQGTTRTTGLPPSARRALVAVYLGLALTVLAALAVVVDGDGLARHLHDIEDSWIGVAKANETPSVVTTYLFVVAALGIVSWLVTAWAVRRRKRWARPFATTVFVLAAGIAVLNLTMREYGRTILPALHGVAGVLPCVAGLVAVVLLWRRDRVSV
ncbi:hypothetical protein [Amycolatopsis anabasis]|uniref:hypothetical protein n=1 Tax=Amycolatopsis anabasis TaxID=1840409 RepID=UPI001C552788|nr:hypothetical protein [Amycolatopsis anabasis]